MGVWALRGWDDLRKSASKLMSPTESVAAGASSEGQRRMVQPLLVFVKGRGRSASRFAHVHDDCVEPQVGLGFEGWSRKASVLLRPSSRGAEVVAADRTRGMDESTECRRKRALVHTG